MSTYQCSRKRRPHCGLKGLIEGLIAFEENPEERRDPGHLRVWLAMRKGTKQDVSKTEGAGASLTLVDHDRNAYQSLREACSMRECDATQLMTS